MNNINKNTITLTNAEVEQLQEILKTKQLNNSILQAYSDFLINNPDAINEDLIGDVKSKESKLEKYKTILSHFLFDDVVDKQTATILYEEYINNSVCLLDVKTYKNNPYYKNIKFNNAKVGNWTLEEKSYKPYEAFIYNDTICDENFREIPKLGFFDEEFKFLAVLENGVEWMTITPNEIESMKAGINNAKGDVVTFGLGLGYFQYMASLKEDVNSITIVESDENVIKLFSQNILPQFEMKHKIKIVKADAYDYIKNTTEHFDFAYVDLWHDVSDGLYLYLKMKGHEEYMPKTKFMYWIEEPILIDFRTYVFVVLLNKIKRVNCGLEFYKRILEIERVVNMVGVNNFSDILNMLKSNSLRKLAKNIDWSKFE